MSLKLKVFLGVLLLIAGFLVVRLGLYFNKSVKTAALISQTIITPAPEENWLTKDSDGDGLSDRDEIIYGTDSFNKDTDGDDYWDGEEMAGGYDPLDPFDSPKTRTPESGQISYAPPSPNLTDRLLNLGIANLLDENGDLNPDQMTTKRFADIISAANNEAALYLSAPPLTDSEIKIIDDNSSARITKYLKTVTLIIEEGIYSSIGGLGSLGQNVGATDKNSDYYRNVANSLKVVEAPSSWKEIHKETIRTFQRLANSFSAVTEQVIETDPVKSSFALNEIQDAFLRLYDLLNQASRLAKSQNVPTGDSIINMLQTANFAQTE
jgi:hypothetical protein